jgi:hypothetical protein
MVGPQSRVSLRRTSRRVPRARSQQATRSNVPVRRAAWVSRPKAPSSICIAAGVPDHGRVINNLVGDTVTWTSITTTSSASIQGATSLVWAPTRRRSPRSRFPGSATDDRRGSQRSPPAPFGMARSDELARDPNADPYRARNTAIWQRHLTGASSIDIAAEVRVTPARVRVIIRRTGERDRDEARADVRPDFIRGHQVGERAAKALRAAGITRWWQIASADQSSLDRLPRIGPVLAAQILAGRPASVGRTEDAEVQASAPAPGERPG